ncbi:hypothetical protein G4H71_13825 [Rhodococcus triatomae]|uniref:Uncharacterized protein n=1 Tax=Rhodococcus triatomae TaxID=300028 RepID=A0A1G8PLH5_9NOCA|nr:hypothetical protein [Rhodococcus triatomae]QNG20125.1 hypothetical protein G4H72_16550 [Rhodococcus triatomae]QNG23959.1 hypothetical protein G4H71_13825 [Rhodococcus triatomae]SDI92690.1 hypothetical protein SAMN05444695_11354 [Rhodococcus triatomae]
MNNASTRPRVHREAGLREAGLHDLLMDAFRVGPAPTRSREAFVVVLTLVLVGLIVALLQPEPVVAAIGGTAIAAYLVIRWIVGTRKWGQR